MHKLKCIVLPLPGGIKNPGFVSSLTETSRCNNAFICYHGKFVRKCGKKSKDGIWQLEH